MKEKHNDHVNDKLPFHTLKLLTISFLSAHRIELFCSSNSFAVSAPSSNTYFSWLNCPNYLPWISTTLQGDIPKSTFPDLPTVALDSGAEGDWLPYSRIINHTKYLSLYEQLPLYVNWSVLKVRLVIIFGFAFWSNSTDEKSLKWHIFVSVNSSNYHACPQLILWLCQLYFVTVPFFQFFNKYPNLCFFLLSFCADSFRSWTFSSFLISIVAITP